MRHVDHALRYRDGDRNRGYNGRGRHAIAKSESAFLNETV